MSVYIIAFLAGIISFISPCIIPMLSVYFSMITGLSLKELRNLPSDKNLKKYVLGNTLMFILAFTIVFTLAGGAAGLMAGFLTKYGRYFEFVGGTLVIILGLNLVGIIKLSFINSCNMPGDKAKFGSGYLSSFVVGIIFAVACSHCIGPVLYSILIMAGSLGSVTNGMLVMFLFSIGLAIPYIVAGLYMDKIIKLIHKTHKVSKTLNIVTGAIIIALGILILTGNFNLLTTFTAKLIPFKLPVGM
ncbi:MAG: cytochrome C biogenesis protein [Clostridiaceae bacterium BRH_c20a]|nr:MAG: cytochrome C biogenesis protein [Clostridiaceae bacterium BRH_c20a]